MICSIVFYTLQIWVSVCFIVQLGSFIIIIDFLATDDVMVMGIKDILEKQQERMSASDYNIKTEKVDEPEIVFRAPSPEGK